MIGQDPHRDRRVGAGPVTGHVTADPRVIHCPVSPLIASSLTTRRTRGDKRERERERDGRLAAMNLLPLLTYVTPLAFFPLVTLANVEKTIFVAPLPPAHPSTPLDDLGLDTLAPENPLLRTGLNASFPLDGRHAGEDGDSTTADSATGSVSWFLLEDLAPGVRYEVRVCWLATVFPPPPTLLGW